MRYHANPLLIHRSLHFARLISVRNSLSLQYQLLPVHLASADPPHAPLPASANARSKQTLLTTPHRGAAAQRGRIDLRVRSFYSLMSPIFAQKNHFSSTQSEIIVNKLDSVGSPRSLIRLFQASIPRGHIAKPRDGSQLFYLQI